jgi:hypothetical protein
MMSRKSVTHPKEAWEWLAVDFIWDKNKNPRILEVNTSPGVSKSNPVLYVKNNRLINELVTLLTNYYVPPEPDTWESEKEVPNENWHLLIDERISPPFYRFLKKECHVDPFPEHSAYPVDS